MLNRNESDVSTLKIQAHIKT